MCSLVLDKIRDEKGAAVAALQGLHRRFILCSPGKRPDVVQVLEDDPLHPHKVPPSQRSVQFSIASPKPRTKWDVSTFDDQSMPTRALSLRVKALQRELV